MEFLKSAVKRVPPLHRAATRQRRRAHLLACAATEKWISSKRAYEILIIFGMQRSGNHLAINWIRGQTPASTVFYNNIRKDSHPFDAWSLYNLRRNKGLPKIILSYEDVGLEDVLSGRLRDFVAQRQRSPGVSVRCGVVLRDPYNLFASRLKSKPERFETDESIDFQQQLYISHGTIARTPREVGGFEVVPILYNRLLADADYRNELSSTLGLEKGDKGLEQVPMNGLGSSFDGYLADHKQIQKGVFERWRALESDPRLRKAVDHPRIRQIGEELFAMPSPF